jgi:hypothetical protein
MGSSKRQQTMAKRARELKLIERRALKQEKKRAASAARKQATVEASESDPRAGVDVTGSADKGDTAADR